MTAAFDLSQFLRRPDGVAACLPAGDLFGLLKRTFDLPAQWAAVATRTTGDHVMTKPGGAIEADGVEDVLITRVSPFDVHMEEEGIVTRDRFQGHVRVELRVSLVADRAELLSFREHVLGSYRIATAANVVRYLQPAVRAALATLAAGKDASDMADPARGVELVDAVAEAIKGPCFTAGLSIADRPVVRFESKTLAKVRREEETIAGRRRTHDASRQLQRAREIAQEAHLDHIASLLTRLHELTEASPEVSLPDLLRTFNERERGEVYQALFASEQETVATQWIAVAAGDEVLYFDPDDTEKAVRRVRVDGPVGALRSIQVYTDAASQRQLLLGAATGVYRLPIHAAEVDAVFSVSDASTVRGGFNAAVAVGDRIFATHSELGIRRWDVKQPDHATPLFGDITAAAKTVRSITFHRGHLYCGCDDRVLRWAADDIGTSPPTAYAGPPTVYTGIFGTVTVLCAYEDGLLIGTNEGDVLQFAADATSMPQRLHTGGHRSVEALWVLESHGVRRLFYTDTSRYVYAQVLGDNFVCRYEAGGQTLRRVDVASDLVVATNDVRDRLICWEPGRPDKPRAVINVAQLCRNSIQDVCLIPRA